MPEATLLYSITAAVIAGLVVWVIAVLKAAKEPWARAPLAVAGAPALEAGGVERASVEEEPAAVPVEKIAVEKIEPKDPAKLDADDTARATPVALSEGRTKAAAASDD